MKLNVIARFLRPRGGSREQTAPEPSPAHPAGTSFPAFAIVALAALSGCSRSKRVDASPASASAATTASAPAEAVVIRYSDPGNSGVLAYAKREGILERELAKVNARIEWVPGPGSFSASFEAMNSGAINASGGAVSPIVGALSHNLNFKIYAICDPGGIRRAGIISPAQSSIRTIKDLVGKRVAVNLAAHGDYILLKSLANQGIPADQVVRVPIQPPDAAAAFATGKIDAWSTFGVFFSTAVRNGAHVVVTEDAIQSDDVGVMSANAAVLAKNPIAFQRLLKVSQDLSVEAHSNPEKFQNVFTDKGPTAVSGDELRIAIEETRSLPVFRVPTDVDRKRIGNVVKILYENKSIDRSLNVSDVVFDVTRGSAGRGG